MTPTGTVICLEPNLVLKPTRLMRDEHILLLLAGKDTMLSPLLLHSRPDPACGCVGKAPPANRERPQKGDTNRERPQKGNTNWERPQKGDRS